MRLRKIDKILLFVFISLGILIFSTVGIYWNLTNIYKIGKMEQLNPTNYVFDAPMDQVKAIIENKREPFSAWQNKHLLEYRYAPIKDTSSLFKDAKGRKIPIEMGFSVLLDSLSPTQTAVQLFAETGYMYYGVELHFRPVHIYPLIHRVFPPRVVFLGSTTIEEYEILQEIGHKLAQKGMPDIVYPN